MVKEYSINDQIKSDVVNLVLPDGGIENAVRLSVALQMAENEGMDLVEVLKKGKNGFPVCKILDYGKMSYKQDKKKKSGKHTQHTKIIKYGKNISPHDLDVKHNQIMKFLEKKYIIQYSMELNGREKNMVEDSINKINDNLESFKEVATWQPVQVSYGRRISISTTLMSV